MKREALLRGLSLLVLGTVSVFFGMPFLGEMILVQSSGYDHGGEWIGCWFIGGLVSLALAVALHVHIWDRRLQQSKRAPGGHDDRANR